MVWGKAVDRNPSGNNMSKVTSPPSLVAAMSPAPEPEPEPVPEPESEATDPPVSRLSRSQALRRRRVLDAALELADRGGYEAVQMRDVSARADVALGTIYRYFPSKDALLAAVLVDWSRGLEAEVTRQRPAGRTTAERMASVVRDALGLVEGAPLLAGAVIQAMVAGGAEVARYQAEVGDALGAIARAAFPEDFDPELAQRVSLVLGYLWFSTLVAWVSGWHGAEDPMARMDEAIHLLLDQYG